MDTIELLIELEQAGVKPEAAKAISKAIEQSAKKQISHDSVQAMISQAKYDLVKWIVAGVVMNGVVASILKYIG